MAAGRANCFPRTGSIVRSRSEGTLIDLDENTLCGEIPKGGKVIQNYGKTTKNPFWTKLSGSNPFLDDIVHNTEKLISSSSETFPCTANHLEIDNADNISTSSDEGNVGSFLEKKNKANSSGRWRSATDILDEFERKVPKRMNSFKPPRPVLNPDFEWLKNDREAYKMAWLSHRQLTRSCLDLNLMSQSPGWAQTQATDFQVICKIGHAGGSVRLPDSEFSIHFPEGHVPPGEVQEVTLKALLDPPPGLNNNYTTTMSPLLEVVLSNINTKGMISLRIKLSGEVRSDPLSQVLTTVIGLLSSKRQGPYISVDDCDVLKNTMHMKLQHLKTHFYVIAVAEASAIQSPATSVWDYLHRQITIAVYGPRYIHPSFKVVIVVCCHEEVPPRLSFSDICRGNKHLPPLVLQLWGTHRLRIDNLHDLFITVNLTGSTFQIQHEDKVKEVKQSKLKIGTVLHLPVALFCTNSKDMSPFQVDLQVAESNSSTVAHFQVPSPPVAPIRCEKRISSRKREEITGNSYIAEEQTPEIPKFQDRPVNLKWYGVALKSVLRQPRVDYLLEYFKGDTVALLSKQTVRSVGNSRGKEWYIGFLRGRTGLVHCKNVKLITAHQVIDFIGIQVTTEALLDNMTLPFKKLTYMYSAIQTLVTEHVTSWRSFAEALGYNNLSLDTITRRFAETEADKVASVLEKLKEDCHAEKSGKKFLHELMVGLLKMDSIYLVAQLIQNTVILSTAVELGVRWRELAEKVGKLTSAQIAAYEAPHRGKNGEVGPQLMWKPAYDFLFSWSQRYGASYRDMIQDLHLILDKMKNPVARQWRQLTGALITVNCLDLFRASAYPKT
ncbi:metastasis-associated in colon cancer protein 1 [Dunckerocampus dactyliophorus]|uniref:metastasis-associated in colon cancer protein 1 n=1 Tax=Dunckerocampus dactyliophorus TaxID=161453 RepID=UPI002406E9AF|nr:metastasis-associated in colon cancer protein 1 [Dunckerocampus dactyliophorus]XP_054639010.1 metastasis-associated in colon cancer protein 1 [Dunckerocampus dactyliophorus]